MKAAQPHPGQPNKFDRTRNQQIFILKILAFHQEEGKVRWTTERVYLGESQREKAIDAALKAVADARARYADS